MKEVNRGPEVQRYRVALEVLGEQLDEVVKSMSPTEKQAGAFRVTAANDR